MMIINVDCDGVLVSNAHEELLNFKVETEGLSYSDLSPIWDWYDWLINNNPLPVNIPILKHLQRMKDEGHVIRLWTNRAYTLRSATLSNLDGWTHLFDTTTFYGGRKHKSNVEGIVIDNNSQYLTCGQTGILYPSFY
jgi:hypothetical protein